MGTRSDGVWLPTDGLRGFDRPVYLVAGARFVNTFGTGVVYPFATLYFVGEVGIAFTLVGLGLLWVALLGGWLALAAGVLAVESGLPAGVNGRRSGVTDASGGD